jgi:hypothetical protein
MAWYFGRPLGESIFMGFLLSLSSTAIVLKLLQERGEVDTPHGRTGLGILIFQDIAIVPMMLFVPLLSEVSENIGVVFSVVGQRDSNHGPGHRQRQVGGAPRPLSDRPHRQLELFLFHCADLPGGLADGPGRLPWPWGPFWLG